MQKRNVLSSPRLQELNREKTKGFLIKTSVFIFLLLAVLVGLSFLSRWSKINIKSMEVTGNRLITTEAIEHFVREELAGHYLWVFPKTNFLFYPRNKIEEKLADEFKRLKVISISLGEANTLLISVAERSPAYTWCGDILPSSGLSPEESRCYFMDDAGYIFEEAPYFSNDVYFRFFGRVERNEEIPTGFSFFSEIWPRIVSFKNTLTRMGLAPSSVLIKEDGDIELYLKSSVLPPDSPKIIFKKDADFEKVAESLEAALSTEPLKSNFENKYSSLLYIDLRFGNKVYFKFSAQGGSASGGN